MSIKRISLVDQVYKKLREDIITLQYRLGAKLSVAELQTQLDVSCTPIREAINRLQQEGLVVYKNNVGAHVLTLEAHDIEEIQQLALTLHQAAIRFAITFGDHKVIATDLRYCLEEYRTAVTPQDEVLAVYHFLGVYYHNCGNKRLDNSMLSIQGQQLLLRYLYANAMQIRSADVQTFEKMLYASERGEAERTCNALQQYTDRMTALLIDQIPHS